MHPFPLPLPKPVNEDQRLYAQAYRCLLGASWQLAGDPAHGWQGAVYTPAQSYADELVEGATVYLQLRADLRERAPS